MPLANLAAQTPVEQYPLGQVGQLDEEVQFKLVLEHKLLEQVSGEVQSLLSLQSAAAVHCTLVTVIGANPEVVSVPT